MRYNFRIAIKKFLLINFGLKRIALPNYVCAARTLPLLVLRGL
jgi:hypothetical protein